MDEVLIEKVKLNQLLYNHKMPTYRDKNEKRAVWDKIGKQLDVTGTFAKLRWDNLRRCYCNARNRRRGSECKQRPWKYEKKMSFLLPYIQDRMVKGSANASAFVDVSFKSDEFTIEGYSEDTTDETTNFEMVKTEERVFDAEPEDIFGKNKEAVDEESENLNDSFSDDRDKNDTNWGERTKWLTKSRAKQKQNFTKKRKCEDGDSCLNTTTENNFLEPFDHTDLFFLSMSKMTKQLPKAAQSKIKFELSNLVLTAEMKFHETQT